MEEEKGAGRIALTVDYVIFLGVASGAVIGWMSVAVHVRLSRTLSSPKIDFSSVIDLINGLNARVIQIEKLSPDERRLDDIYKSMESMQDQLDSVKKGDPISSAVNGISFDQIEVRLSVLEKELLTPYLKFKQKKKVPDAPTAPPVPSAMRGK